MSTVEQYHRRIVWLDRRVNQLYTQGKERAGERLEREADFLREQLSKLEGAR